MHQVSFSQSTSGEPTAWPFQFISLDGESLGTDDLMRLAKGELRIKLTKEAINRITKSRNLLEGIVEENKSEFLECAEQAAFCAHSRV